MTDRVILPRAVVERIVDQLWAKEDQRSEIDVAIGPEDAAALRAALAGQSEMVLVPREPTEKQKMAGINASPMWLVSVPWKLDDRRIIEDERRRSRVSLDTEECAAIYAAMIAASQPEPQAKPEEYKPDKVAEINALEKGPRERTGMTADEALEYLSGPLPEQHETEIGGDASERDDVSSLRSSEPQRLSATTPGGDSAAGAHAGLIAELLKSAESHSRTSKMLAKDKSDRNRSAAGKPLDGGIDYMWLTPEQTVEGRAAAALREADAEIGRLDTECAGLIEANVAERKISEDFLQRAETAERQRDEAVAEVEKLKHEICELEEQLDAAGERLAGEDI